MTEERDSKESVDYELVRKGMEAGERAALESRSSRGWRPRIWAVLLIIVAVLITRLVSDLAS